VGFWAAGSLGLGWCSSSGTWLGMGCRCRCAGGCRCRGVVDDAG